MPTSADRTRRPADLSEAGWAQNAGLRPSGERHLPWAFAPPISSRPNRKNRPPAVVWTSGLESRNAARSSAECGNLLKSLTRP
jgi:hypothetical protein